MDAEVATKFINAVVKSIQSVCHGYVDFSRNIQIIGHLYLNVDSAAKYDYIVNEQVCRNDNESSTMFVSNSYHSEPPAKRVADKERRKHGLFSRTKHVSRGNEPRYGSSDVSAVESDIMLFASESASSPHHSLTNADSFHLPSPSHKSHSGNKRRRTLSGGNDGASHVQIVEDIEAQIVSLIEQDIDSSKGTDRSSQGANKSLRQSDTDRKEMICNEESVTSPATGSRPSSTSGPSGWDINSSQQTAVSLSGNKDTAVSETLSSLPSRASATVSRAPSAEHKELESSPKSSNKSVKEEPPVDVDLTLVKDEETNPSMQSSCMQANKNYGAHSSSSVAAMNFDMPWDVSSHVQQQKDSHSRVMRMDASGSAIEYSSMTDQGQDHSNIFDNTQLFPVMLHPNTAAPQDVLAAVSMVEARGGPGQSPNASMNFSTAGPLPSTSGHRMDMIPKPNVPRPGRLPRNVAEQYGMAVHNAMAPTNRKAWGNPRASLPQMAKGPGGFGPLSWQALCPPRPSQVGHHPGRRMCGLCGKSFHKDYIKGHMALHTGVEKFSCGVCGRKFKWASSLASHRCFFKMPMTQNSQRFTSDGGDGNMPNHPTHSSPSDPL